MEDSGIGKIAYFYPIVTGIILTLISIGGFIASVHFLGDRLNDHDRHLQKIDTYIETQSDISSRLSIIEASHEKRLDKIEDLFERLIEHSRK